MVLPSPCSLKNGQIIVGLWIFLALTQQDPEVLNYGNSSPKTPTVGIVPS